MKNAWVTLVVSSLLLIPVVSYAQSEEAPGGSDFEEPCTLPECIGPVLSGAQDIVLSTTDADAVLSASYDVSATDNIDESVIVICNPASGTDSFPLGDTLVECSTTDSHGNTSTASFHVTVELQEEQVQQGFALESTIHLHNGCEVADATGIAHIFPISTSTEYLAICALQQAVDEGAVESIEFADFGFGLFVNSVNGTTLPNSYWKLNLNGTGSNVGASELPLTSGDTVSLVLTAYDPVTFTETTLDFSVDIHIDALLDTYHNISLPSACTVSDTTGSSHDFSDSYLGICALVEAKNEGHIESYELVEFAGVGLFADSIDGIKDPSTSYWALYHNGIYEETRGLITLPLVVGDTMSLIYTNFITNATSSSKDVRVIALREVIQEENLEPEPSGSGSGGGGGGGVSHITFNVPAALAYLSSKQEADGSFSSSLLTDWAAIAFAAADPGEAKAKLKAFLESTAPGLSGVQDNIRHAMALMALGIDPYAGTSVDYIAPIVASFDGTQIGDASLDNDDIFALFPLTHAGYSSADEMISKSVAFILSRQQENGSWVGGVDVTAAAVQSLAPLSSLSGVSAAITKAESYLRLQQQNTGGFANSSATSWTMQAIAALGQQQTSWSVGGLYPSDYLASLQQSDGGVEPTSASDLTRIWATEYAIPGATGRTWNSLLTSFARPAAKTTSNTGGGVLVTTETATSTPVITMATTTPLVEIATTSPASANTEATSTPIAEILAGAAEEVEGDTPPEHLAQIPAQTLTSEETPVTVEETRGQVAAAAAAGDTDWTLFLLTLLALILLGIGGYVGFARKYWR